MQVATGSFQFDMAGQGLDHHQVSGGLGQVTEARMAQPVGRRPILIVLGILGTLCTVPILTTLQTVQTWWGAFFLIMAALVIFSGYTSINAVVNAELFRTEIRALGVGLPYALTVSIFGGTAEYVAL